jgi:hypothetical protein
VLPLAVVLAYADGFWVTALRSSVGSIERSQGLFTSWVRESTLVLPIFVVAVLAALVLGQRRFGGRPRGLRAVASVLAMVAGLGTVVGALRLAASSAYDYHLQVVQMAMMDMMKNNCSVSCRNAQLDATLHLQVRAVALGTLVLLVTNLLLVCWVVALRGGRLRLTADRAPLTVARVVADRFGLLRCLLAAALVTTAVVHATVVPGHLTRWSAAGALFAVLTAMELALAAALVTRRRPLALLPVVFAVDGTLLLWLAFRSLGTPFGTGVEATDRVALTFGVVGLLEVAALVAALAVLRVRPWVRRAGSADALGHPSGHLLGSTLVAVVAVAALALGAGSLSLVGPADPGTSGGAHLHHAAHV